VASGKLGVIEYKINFYFSKIQSLVCGTHPKTNLLHPQWIMDRNLLRIARDFLEGLPSGAQILDLGCGNGPYWHLNPSLNWVGVDVIETPRTSVVVKTGESLPFEKDTFDFVLCTQVLEHIDDNQFMIDQIERVMKPGGLLLVNVPFLYPLHGLPWDYHRITPERLGVILQNFHIDKILTCGGIGSSISTLWNNFWQDWGHSSFHRRAIFIALWPLFLFSCLISNSFSIILDYLDKTYKYPLIVYSVSSKPKMN